MEQVLPDTQVTDDDYPGNAADDDTDAKDDPFIYMAILSMHERVQAKSRTKPGGTAGCIQTCPSSSKKRRGQVFSFKNNIRLPRHIIKPDDCPGYLHE